MRFSLTRDKHLAPPSYTPARAEIPALRGADMAAVYYGQRQAGDFYDFLRVHPERVLFGLLDVAGGLGETRAILSQVQSVFRTAGCSLFAPDDVNESDAMVELSLQLNQAVIQAAQGVRSCPAFAGCYNETLGVVCYVNAGHTPGVVRDATGITELRATGLPLGLFSHAAPDAPMVALTPGAGLLLASRGVIEGKRHGDEYGLDRLKENFRGSHATSANETCINAIDALRQFMGTAPTHDDVTTLTLLREDSSSNSTQPS